MASDHSPWRACPLKFRTFAKLETFLSALLFIEMVCEVGLAKLDLENLKTEIIGEKCQKGREHSGFLASSLPPTRLWRVTFCEYSPVASRSLAVAS